MGDPAEESSNPFRAFFDIRREERPKSFMMFGYFVLVITTFWILKPIKKSLFLSFYDVSGFNLSGWQMKAADAELLAKLLNMFVAYVAVVVFSALSNRFHRQQLTAIFGVFFIACFALYGLVLDEPASLTVWTFYLFGDLYSTLMVTVFFVFLNDISTPDSAKRTYGLVGLGGVVGGFMGSMALASLIKEVDNSTWLLVCLTLTAIIIGLGLAVGRIHDREHPEVHSTAMERTAGGNPALEGARLVLRSRYLMAVVGIVGIYEMVSTILDYQFSATISHYLDGDEIRSHMTVVFAIMNGTAFVVQLFITSFVMTRFGIKTALMVLPATTFLASAGFIALPILWVGSLIPTLDGGFAYSINQSAKESLYVPTTKEEKYKAKAFIDMFGQRFAKALAVGLTLLISRLVSGDFSGVRWLSVVTILLTSSWLAIARYAGKHFDELADGARRDQGGGRVSVVRD